MPARTVTGSSPADVKAYYDAKVGRQVRDFLDGNRRVDRAWATVERFAPAELLRVLEIGCGIGATCRRIADRWPHAEVVGLDVSAELLAAADTLFGSDRVSFVEGPLSPGLVTGPFDLVVLLDVYEHIAPDDRPALHRTLADLMGDDSRIVVTTPTPRHLEWLREHHPEEIQPIDEDISVSVLLDFAAAVRMDLCFYEEVDVWHEGDYLHAVLGRRSTWTPVRKRSAARADVRTRAFRRVASRFRPTDRTRDERLELVRTKLGSDWVGEHVKN